MVGGEIAGESNVGAEGYQVEENRGLLQMDVMLRRVLLRVDGIVPNKDMWVGCYVEKCSQTIDFFFLLLLGCVSGVCSSWFSGVSTLTIS